MENSFNEIWASLVTYFDELVIFIPKLIVGLLIFIIFYLIARRTGKFVTRRLTNRMDDPLLARFIGRVTKITIVVLSLFVVMQILDMGGIATGIITGASISAIVVGFAFKDIGENFLASIMLAFDRPFKVGDIVELDGITGKVLALNLRNTHIKTFDGKDIFIPNADVIKNPVVNFTMDGFLRYDFTVGLDYGSDVNQAMQLVLDTLKKINGILQAEKKPSIAVSQLGSSALELTIYFWLDTFDKAVSSVAVKNQAISQVLQVLDENGYYLPGNVLEMKNYKEATLKINP